MTESTLVFFVDWGRIWLAVKNFKVGAGKPNGYGGKKKRKDKTIEVTAIRETGEESGFYPDASMLTKVAVIDFYKAGKHVFRCHIYLCRKNKDGQERWNGELKATREMAKPEPYLNWAVPYERMMPADKEWLPRILRGERFKASVYYNADNTALEKPFKYIAVPDGEPLE